MGIQPINSIRSTLNDEGHDQDDRFCHEETVPGFMAMSVSNPSRKHHQFLYNTYEDVLKKKNKNR